MRGLLLAGITTIVIGLASAVCMAQTAAPAADAKPELRPELVQRWEKMTPAEREQMRERMARWRAMNADERQKILLNMERFRQLTPEQRERLLEARHKWDKVSPGSRQRMRQQFERWRELPPEVRQRVMQHMTLAKELLKKDFETLKQTPEDQRGALSKSIHQKIRALMGLKGEQFQEFRNMTPEDQTAKLKELIENLPLEERQGHEGREGREGREGHHWGLERPEPETTNPTPAPVH